MADPARKPNALIKDTAKSDTSSDVQVLDHITNKYKFKCSKPTSQCPICWCIKEDPTT